MEPRSRVTLRDRLGAPLRDSRLAAGLELMILPVLLVLKAAGVLRNPSQPLFLLGWLSLWLRRSGWRQVGMARPAHWPRTVIIAIVAGIAYNAFDIFVLIPFLHRLTGEPLDLSQLDSMKGNWGALLLLVAATWSLFAFVEEMGYRGYALNRFTDAFGRSPLSRAFGVALISVAFGLAHKSQGVTGILDNVLAGVWFSVLYLASGNNLWLPILAHGVEDTTSLVLLYLGFRPQ